MDNEVILFQEHSHLSVNIVHNLSSRDRCNHTYYTEYLRDVRSQNDYRSNSKAEDSESKSSLQAPGNKLEDVYIHTTHVSLLSLNETIVPLCITNMLSTFNDNPAGIEIFLPLTSRNSEQIFTSGQV